MENEPDTLNLGELGSLLTSIAHYGMEADRCENAEAHTASCIMLGAVIEGYLMIAVSVRPKEAEAALKRLQQSQKKCKNCKVSNILEWHLSDLLNVAEEAGWLPQRLARFPFSALPEAGSEAPSVGLLKDLRNMVHPGRLIRDRRGRIVAKEDLERLHETCLSIQWHLAETLSPKIKELQW